MTKVFTTGCPTCYCNLRRNFFYICDYFGITPREFFDDETPCPQQLHRLMDALKALDAKQLDALVNLAEQMKR